MSIQNFKFILAHITKTLQFQQFSSQNINSRHKSECILISNTPKKKVFYNLASLPGYQDSDYGEINDSPTDFGCCAFKCEIKKEKIVKISKDIRF